MDRRLQVQYVYYTRGKRAGVTSPLFTGRLKVLCPVGKRAGVTGPLVTGRGVLYDVCTILPFHTVIIIHYNCEEIIFCNSTLRTLSSASRRFILV